MATTKDAKLVTPTEKVSTYKIIFSFAFFYLHLFFWLLMIACFGIIAEF